MTDEFSNYKSAALWAEDAPIREEPTGELKPFRSALIIALDNAAASFEMARLSESPIETLFGARLGLFMTSWLKDLFQIAEPDVLPSKPVVLKPQFKLDSFRYDFCILVDQNPVVLIECDGKDFHSSDEQRANDVLKDAAASSASIPLLRFSGSHIHRDVDDCVETTISTLVCEGRIRNYF